MKIEYTDVKKLRKTNPYSILDKISEEKLDESKPKFKIMIENVNMETYKMIFENASHNYTYGTTKEDRFIDNAFKLLLEHSDKMKYKKIFLRNIIGTEITPYFEYNDYNDKPYLKTYVISYSKMTLKQLGELEGYYNEINSPVNQQDLLK